MKKDTATKEATSASFMDTLTAAMSGTEPPQVSQDTGPIVVPGENVVATVNSPSIMSLSALADRLSEEADVVIRTHKAAHRTGRHAASECERFSLVASRLVSRSKLAAGLMWLGIVESIPGGTDPDAGLALRKDWKVVSDKTGALEPVFESSTHPASQLFRKIWDCLSLNGAEVECPGEPLKERDEPIGTIEDRRTRALWGLRGTLVAAEHASMPKEPDDVLKSIFSTTLTEIARKGREYQAIRERVRFLSSMLTLAVDDELPDANILTDESAGIEIKEGWKIVRLEKKRSRKSDDMFSAFADALNGADLEEIERVLGGALRGR